ncbi:Predicted dehydrogenase [Catalinimonas alkaloidigena]|uniref:Predicted dehydrogenase n=1 Tax=Catalinimonas alkaloidigena TaxID=1075417 RepID=A0A1G9IKQ8_9BACT|nr:Gfo/Idh/MocA family oxidoreductase [Catalinimonas alkaloidigena]SDL25645.1 Predicted dehydrogenase [Catalinimonas alkaloidigena]
MPTPLLSCFLLALYLPLFAVAQGKEKPLKIGIVSLTHSHVHGLLAAFRNQGRADIQIVGIAEANRQVAQRYATQYGFSMDLVYPTMEAMLEATRPEAVTAFGPIDQHLAVVEACAPRGIHVMVEKPLAVNLDHARKMEALAKKHSIQLLTNYETTWYPTNAKAYALLEAGEVGDLVKIVVRDGHRGPKHIVGEPEFLEWLIDPIQNGGGAIMDFGCYGVNLSTWLQRGKKPLSVTAVTQQLQPENNPKVDDEATIILHYDDSQALIQPSWNWPIGRKDMEVYGRTGVLLADNKYDLRVRYAEGYDGFQEKAFHLEDRESPYNDPFAFYAAVVRKKITLEPYDLSSLENNMIVMEILEAATRSAAEKKTIFLGK